MAAQDFVDLARPRDGSETSVDAGRDDDARLIAVLAVLTLIDALLVVAWYAV